MTGDPGPPTDIPSADGDGDIVEIDAYQAAFGVMKVISVASSPLPVEVRVPPGTGDGTVLSAPGPLGVVPVTVRVRSIERGASGPGAVDRGAAAPPRRRRVRVAALALALAVVVVIGLGVAWRVAGGSGRGDGSTRTSTAGSSQPSPTPVTPEAYGQALAAADTALTPAFQQVGAASSMPALHTAAWEAATVVQTQAEHLKALTPPAAVQSRHTDLVFALGMLGYELQRIDQDRADGRACLGSAALPLLGQSATAGQLRRAAESMATTDPAHQYRFGAFLPPAGPLPDRTLDNGAYVVRTAKNGRGELKVENRGARDAAISLVPTATKRITVTMYVRAGQTATARGIPDGTYETYLTSGRDWDAAAKGFARDCQFERFTDTSTFTTTGRTYTIWTVTLEAGTGGNTESEDVDPGAYPTG